MARRVLVTGAERGIGKAVALRLADAGFDIAVHCRSNVKGAEETADAVRSKGRSAEILRFDVSDRNAAREALEGSMEVNGAFWGIVSNAGVIRDAPFPAMGGDDWDLVINTNLSGFYNVVNPCVMPMIRLRDGGRIVAVSSVSGVAGNRGQVNYSASKGGLIAACKALSLELAKRGITVNAVAPGVIETDMLACFTREELDDMADKAPLERNGTPEDVARITAWLASDACAFLTGAIIPVDGGNKL